MTIRGAILRQAPGKYEVVELEFDNLRSDELEVKLYASGLCHSDDHFATNDVPLNMYPMIGGHEGAGIVTKAFSGNRKGIKEGDHVVFSYVPSCGFCRWCSNGQQNLCDLGAGLLGGARSSDPESFRAKTADGLVVGQANGISTFATQTVVSIDSAIKIDESIPFTSACLVGCGVGTGWGSAVNMAEVRPGDTVIIMGIGGIGINAVQGAKHAGAMNILAVDPVEFKRSMALKLGATQAFSSIAEATEIARELTNGQGADSAIVAVGVTTPQHVGDAFAATRKGSTTVVTGVGNNWDTSVGVPISLSEMTFYQKRLQGTIFGGSTPNWDIPRQLALYQNGMLKLDELVTTTYELDAINDAFRDMHEGKNIRGVLAYT